jgi:hypothetical protein
MFFIKELLSNFKVCLGQTKMMPKIKILGAKKLYVKATSSLLQPRFL